MNIKSKKYFYATAVIVFGLVAYNHIGSSKEHDVIKKPIPTDIEEVAKTNFIKPADKISTKKEVAVSERIKAKKTPIAVETSHEELDVLDDDKRQVSEYVKELPPIPDKEYVKKHFVDFNSNGVRDDIEIEIVEEFGDEATCCPLR